MKAVSKSMVIKWAKSNSKFCQIFSSFDIMNIVNRSTRRSYLNKCLNVSYSIVAYSDGISMKYFMEFVVG